MAAFDHSRETVTVSVDQLRVKGRMYSAVSNVLDRTDNYDTVLAYQVINPTPEPVAKAKITSAGTNQIHVSLWAK